MFLEYLSPNIISVKCR